MLSTWWRHGLDVFTSRAPVQLRIQPAQGKQKSMDILPEGAALRAVLQSTVGAERSQRVARAIFADIMTRSTSLEDRAHWDEFVHLDEQDRRELIDGRLVEVEVPTERHEWVVGSILAALFNWSQLHGGRALGSGYKIRIDERRGVMPDVQFYRKGRPANPPHGLESGAPDLVVEVVSPASVRYDRVTKLNWYASIGAPEYWLIDPEALTLEQLVLEGKTYRIATSLAEQGRFEPSTFPGLVVELSQLFAMPE